MKTQCMGGPHDGRAVDVAWPMPRELNLVDDDLLEVDVLADLLPVAASFRVSRYELGRWCTERGMLQWRYRYTGSR